MIERTFRRCAQGFPEDRIVVATDDERVFEHCQSVGIRALMTPDTCLTGTDRVACVTRLWPADTYINVQGDEPLVDPDDLRAVVAAAQANPNEIVNGMCPIDDEALFRSPTIPKVVTRPDGRLLYMSRAAIPTDKAHGFTRAWRQVCIYAFPRAALEDFAASPDKTELERIEDIEILRFLEMGYEVRMIPLSANSIAVDTPDDVARAEAAIVARGLRDRP
jgi:3-deoxy-manno-octulosonate cytidylyltransferase (CMP-KDO synthetase)